MRPERAGTDQRRISPGQRLFKHASITFTTEMSGSALCRGQATIKTDRQNQSNLRPGNGQRNIQTAATVSRDVGIISS